MAAHGFFNELKRRNVIRAGALYVGATWALAQGISQLGPAVGLPDWATRRFLIAAAIGFPFWLFFAWFYQLTPDGLKRESESSGAPLDDDTRHFRNRQDRWIVGLLSLAVVLLLADAYWRPREVVQVRNTADTAAAQDAIPPRSVAVLPLRNESGDTVERFFSDGLSEDMITALSQFDGLKVISRNSSFRFRDSRDEPSVIGAKLGVAHLIEGSVRRLGDTVRISATLVRASDGSTVWSQRYDRPYHDLFALQDEITQAVANALQARWLEGNGAVVQSDRPSSGDLEAYRAYLRAIALFDLETEVGQRQGIDALNEAIRHDPRYAAAHARLGSAWIGLANLFLGGAEAREAYAKARAAIDTAIALDPNSAAAHRARGDLLASADLDWVGAEAAYRRALQLAPHHGGLQFALGDVLATLGQPERAVELTRQALATDPHNANWHAWLSAYLLPLGRLDEAKAEIETAISMQPQTYSYVQLAIVDILRGDVVAAHAAALRESAGIWQNVAIALAAQIGPDRKEADAALARLIAENADTSAYQVAQVYALRGEADATFQWLERAWSNRDTGLSMLLYDPFILRFRDDPRFAAFCNKAGLQTSTDALAMP